MNTSKWPDSLELPDAQRVDELLSRYWRQLAELPDLVNRGEHLLAEKCTTNLRTIIIEMMLALNGIRYPVNTAHLNGYLGASQRAVLEKTLVAEQVAGSSWVGRAVALTVIYRWYAPQLTERFALEYPGTLEQEVWQLLVRDLAEWPQTVTTE